MGADYTISSAEIPAKGKGYLVLTNCRGAEADGLLRRAGRSCWAWGPRSSM